MTFRSWLQEMWYTHVDEMIAVTGKEPSYTSHHYFNKYRWWLKREYRHQHGTK